MDNRRQLDTFLANQEQHAFKTAQLSVGQADDALDIVQDTMIKFVEKYAHKPQPDWKPLFYRILYSRLTDFHRRKNFRGGIMRLFGLANDDKPDELEQTASAIQNPEQQTKTDISISALEKAMQQLPSRQQQAVMLRAWEGLDTQEAASVMGLSTGSVKTHYSRGLKKLRDILGDYWP